MGFQKLISKSGIRINESGLYYNAGSLISAKKDIAVLETFIAPNLKSIGWNQIKLKKVMSRSVFYDRTLKLTEFGILRQTGKGKLTFCETNLKFYNVLKGILEGDHQASGLKDLEEMGKNGGKNRPKSPKKIEKNEGIFLRAHDVTVRLPIEISKGEYERIRKDDPDFHFSYEGFRGNLSNLKANMEFRKKGTKQFDTIICIFRHSIKIRFYEIPGLEMDQIHDVILDQTRSVVFWLHQNYKMRIESNEREWNIKSRPNGRQGLSKLEVGIPNHPKAILSANITGERERWYDIDENNQTGWDGSGNRWESEKKGKYPKEVIENVEKLWANEIFTLKTGFGLIEASNKLKQLTTSLDIIEENQINLINNQTRLATKVYDKNESIWNKLMFWRNKANV